MSEPYYDEGGIMIYHGDCRKILPSIEADVLVTDPPYGIAYASGRIGRLRGVQIANDGDTALRDEVLAGWEGPAAVFGTWKRPRPADVRAVLTWDKGEGVGMGDLALPWRPNTEEIYILGEGWRGHRGSAVLRDTSVVSWTGNGRGPRRLHPNEKPVPLLRGLIEKAPPGTILDPFMGSGTTLRAAKDLGRKAIGIEIEERYCEIAAICLAQEVLALGLKPVKEETVTVELTRREVVMLLTPTTLTGYGPEDERLADLRAARSANTKLAAALSPNPRRANAQS